MADEPRIVSTAEHYDLLIDEGNDPYRDAPLMQEYMSRWDGPLFFEALGSTEGKDVLEIGVGTGRLARRVLDMGCRAFAGLDISAKTVKRARENLKAYPNICLMLGDIEEFRFCERFDVAYSVLTFMHIERKRVALANIVEALHPHGILVLSLSNEGECLDFGSHKVRLYPAPVEDYVAWLTELGCRVDQPIDLVDRAYATDSPRRGDEGEGNRAADCSRSETKVATLVRAEKIHP